MEQTINDWQSTSPPAVEVKALILPIQIACFQIRKEKEKIKFKAAFSLYGFLPRLGALFLWINNSAFFFIVP